MIKVNGYMERYESKVKLIKQLEDKIKSGHDWDRDEFISYLDKNGTPLIDELEDDEDNCLVTFIYISECEVENVLFLSDVQFGEDEYYLEDYNLEEHKMKTIQGTNIWYSTYKVRNDIRFSHYYFPNDSLKSYCEKRWSNVKYDKFSLNKTIFKIPSDGSKEHIESACVMPKWEDNLWAQYRSEVPSGKLEDYNFQSKNFKDKSLVNIYTPYGYNKDAAPYGFILLTDGWDCIHTLSAKNVLDNLIAEKKIPPMVAIFFNYFDVRNDELSCNDKFCNAIVRELLPWVRDRYNISNKASEAIIGGLSLGGLTATYLGLKYSDIFGNVLSQSGSYWYKPEDYEANENEWWMSTQFKGIDKLPLKFYLNVGILENRWMIDPNIDLKDTLLSLGYQVDFEMFKSGHDYLSWGHTLANGLIALTKK